jgi:CheY-like chemotaxis protein
VSIGSRVTIPASPPPLAGLRVLVVDDDAPALTMLCAVLRAAGAQAVCVDSGVEALAWLRGHGVECFLCDVHMPGLDGFEVMRRVRQLAPLAVASVPAVAITAHPSFETRRDAQRAGFHDLVSKSIEPEVLVDLVRRLCRPA